MKKTLLSRRGAAIEMAIGVLYLMMGLSIILVSSAAIQNSQRRKDFAEFNNKVELMEITDYIIENPEATTYGEDYSITYNEGNYTVTNTKNNSVVLEFTVTDGKISSWN